MMESFFTPTSNLRHGYTNRYYQRSGILVTIRKVPAVQTAMWYVHQAS